MLLQTSGYQNAFSAPLDIIQHFETQPILPGKNHILRWNSLYKAAVYIQSYGCVRDIVISKKLRTSLLQRHEWIKYSQIGALCHKEPGLARSFQLRSPKWSSLNHRVLPWELLFSRSCNWCYEHRSWFIRLHHGTKAKSTYHGLVYCTEHSLTAVERKSPSSTNGKANGSKEQINA